MTRVLRGAAARRARPIVDAAEDADAVRRHAEAEAGDRLRAAEREADILRAGARSEGLAAGRAELAAEHARLADARARALGAIRHDVAALGLAVARRLLGEELRLAPERITAVVDQVLARAGRAGRAQLRLHPDDLPAMSAALESDRGATPALELVADATIERGGCVLTSDVGEVDARVATRIEAFRRALLDGTGEEDPTA